MKANTGLLFLGLSTRLLDGRLRLWKSDMQPAVAPEEDVELCCCMGCEIYCGSSCNCCCAVALGVAWRVAVCVLLPVSVVCPQTVPHY
jgi:hypothetical protein